MMLNLKVNNYKYQVSRRFSSIETPKYVSEKPKKARDQSQPNLQSFHPKEEENEKKSDQ